MPRPMRTYRVVEYHEPVWYRDGDTFFCAHEHRDGTQCSATRSAKVGVDTALHGQIFNLRLPERVR